jgi:rhodanese-related sulfurtransferase
MLDSLRRLFGGGSPAPAATPPARSPARPTPPPEPEPDPDDIVVPEVSVAELRAALDAPAPPLVLDVREPYEWAQVHLPGSLGAGVRYLSMNSVPDAVASLPADRTIVVMCAHGSRSYGVTHFLREQKLNAVNLTGGITRWAQSGGATERGTPPV